MNKTVEFITASKQAQPVQRPLWLTDHELDMVTIPLQDLWNGTLERSQGTPEPEQYRTRLTEIGNFLDHIAAQQEGGNGHV